MRLLLAAFISVVVLGLSVLTYVSTARIFDRLEPAVRQDLAWKAVRGAADLAHSTDLGIAANERRLIQQAIAPYLEDTDLGAIVIQDAAGQTLLQHGRAKLDINGLASAPALSVQRPPGQFAAWAPASIEGSLVGRVFLSISTSRLDEGRRMRDAVVRNAGLGCLVALAASLLFVGLYVAPIVNLTERTLADLQELNTRLETRVAERTADLQGANEQLRGSMEELSRTQRRLVDTSRQAGMAEVATAVLHNVGNVLNSVNVSAELVSSRVQNSHARFLDKAVDMIRAHEIELAHFLTQDARGKQFPGYLAKVATSLREERTTVLNELASLRKNVDHIKTIITLQQTHARPGHSLAEPLELRELIDEAMRFASSVDAESDVTTVLDLQGPESVVTDRHAVSQILVNLLTNARQALQRREGLRRVTVRTRRVGSDRFALDVEDTGVGIAPDTIDKLFNHGFTTKKNGHGFGLAASVLTARQMGGDLTAASPGPGQGARFTLELPVVPPASNRSEHEDRLADSR